MVSLEWIGWIECNAERSDEFWFSNTHRRYFVLRIMLVRHKGSKKFCKLALQLVKSHNDKRSIRKRRFRASLSQDYLLELLLSAQIWCACHVIFSPGVPRKPGQIHSNPSRTQATNRLTSNQRHLTAPKARPINTSDSNNWITYPELVFSFPADCNTIVCNKKRLLHNQKKMHTFALNNARMAESVDATVSNTVGVIRAGSTPAPGTRPWRRAIFSMVFFVGYSFASVCAKSVFEFNTK